MSLLKYLCWAAKPGSKLVDPGRLRASHQSLRLWKSSGKQQVGYSFFSQPASKTDRASLTRTPRGSMDARSIFKKFESRALTPIRLTNDITRKSSSKKHQRDRGSTWAGGLASSAVLGMTEKQTFAVGLAVFDAVLKPICTIALAFLGGVAYVKFYKAYVNRKMKKAFQSGYEPALLEGKRENHQRGLRTRRLEQRQQIDNIISGNESGQYWTLLGPKGSGKSTMILDAISDIRADGLAYVEAHPDLEVFRLRLGKALNFTFSEDTQSLLFKRKDAREGGPSPDIERALEQLEKVASKVSYCRKKPLVLVFNNIHHFRHTDEGRNTLLQLQQYAEKWAEWKIVTVVFVSDDFWAYDVLNKYACAGSMGTITVKDLNQKEAISFVKEYNRDSSSSSTNTGEITDAVLKAFEVIGGRISFLKRMRDILERKGSDPIEALKSATERRLSQERAWLLEAVGPVPQITGQATSEQILSVKTWTLLHKLVNKYDDHVASLGPDVGLEVRGEYEGFYLPSLSYDEAMEIMTSSEDIYRLVSDNIIAIDDSHDVRPDSNFVLRAARDILKTKDIERRLKEAEEHIRLGRE